MSPRADELASWAGEQTRNGIRVALPSPVTNDFATRLRRRRRRQSTIGGAVVFAAILGLAVTAMRPASLPLIGNDLPTPPTEHHTTARPTAPESPTAPAVSVDRTMDELGMTPLSARTGHSVVWTGSEMIVWGGQGSDDPATEIFGDGAAYDPDRGSWRTLAAPDSYATSRHASVWTGDAMLVVGGVGNETATWAFDPVRDEWSRRADAPFPVRAGWSGWAWTGTELTVWTPREGLATFDPDEDRWTLADAPPIDDLETADQYEALRAHGDHLYAVLGPVRGTLHVAVRTPDGAWRRAEDLDGRRGTLPNGASLLDWSSPALTVATEAGLLAITSSGESTPAALLDPTSATWSDLDAPGIPSCEDYPTPIAVPDGAILLNYCGNGALFDAATRTFTPAGFPTTGGSDVTVWTGDSLLTAAAGCCFGSRGLSVMATWQRTLPQAIEAGKWTRHDLVADTTGMVPGWFPGFDGPNDLYLLFWRFDPPPPTPADKLTKAIAMANVAPSGTWTPFDEAIQVLGVTIEDATITVDLDSSSAGLQTTYSEQEAEAALEMVKRNAATLFPEATILCLTYDGVASDPRVNGPEFLGHLSGCPVALTSADRTPP